MGGWKHVFGHVVLIIDMLDRDDRLGVYCLMFDSV